MRELFTLRLDQVPPEHANVLLAALVGVGLVYCFLGYPIFRFVLGLTGFLIAGGTAAAIIGWFSQGHMLAMVGAGLFGGICGAMALVFLYRAGVFLIGLLGTALLLVATMVDNPQAWGPLVIVVLGLLGGAMALILERPVMKLATAAIGGWVTAVSGMFLLVHHGTLDKGLKEQLTPHATILLVCAWGALTLFGAVFQFTLKSRKGQG